jgi:hypothetical protein
MGSCLPGPYSLLVGPAERAGHSSGLYQGSSHSHAHACPGPRLLIPLSRTHVRFGSTVSWNRDLKSRKWASVAPSGQELVVGGQGNKRKSRYGCARSNVGAQNPLGTITCMGTGPEPQDWLPSLPDSTSPGFPRAGVGMALNPIIPETAQPLDLC